MAVFDNQLIKSLNNYSSLLMKSDLHGALTTWGGGRQSQTAHPVGASATAATASDTSVPTPCQ